MAAYNFQKQFVPAIKSGAKKNTIRRIGKRRHANPNEAIQLYTGMRTKKCKKIISPDPICLFRLPIKIGVGLQEIHHIHIGSSLITDLNQFARGDGFKDIKAMHAFWINFHGQGLFEGLFIGWGADQ